jgi:hypothetical protein
MNVVRLCGRWPGVLRLLAPLVLAAALPGVVQAQSRGIEVVPPVTATGVAASVRPGHALVIGASQYRSARWADLLAVPDETHAVAAALRRQGFQVQTELDLPAERWFEVMRRFISTHGTTPSNRLVFYVAAHGYSRGSAGQRGYLVPVDAPHPDDDLPGFLASAIDMSQVLAWARQIEARHALFIFDSCFAGTVLQQRSAATDRPLAQRYLSEPVRQFITAGSAGETVPARSEFAPVLVDALDSGRADLNGDGVTTGTELGAFLQGQVGQYGRQTPWFGKIPDAELSRGEFVFASGRASTAPPREPPVIAEPPRPARLRIESTPGAADVWVDGVLRGRTPLTLESAVARRYALEIRASGYLPRQHTVNLEPGGDQRLVTVLERAPTLARLTIDVDPPEAHVRLRDADVAYRRGLPLPPGEYRIEVSAPGYRTRHTTVTVDHADVQLAVSLHREPPRIRTPAPAPPPPRWPAPAAVPVPVATCFARNTFGQTFYWMGPTAPIAMQAAMGLCQGSTPMGAFCRIDGCR